MTKIHLIEQDPELQEIRLYPSSRVTQCEDDWDSTTTPRYSNLLTTNSSDYLHMSSASEMLSSFPLDEVEDLGEINNVNLHIVARVVGAELADEGYLKIFLLDSCVTDENLIEYDVNVSQAYKNFKVMLKSNPITHEAWDWDDFTGSSVTEPYQLGVKASSPTQSIQYDITLFPNSDERKDFTTDYIVPVTTDYYDVINESAYNTSRYQYVYNDVPWVSRTPESTYNALYSRTRSSPTTERIYTFNYSGSYEFEVFNYDEDAHAFNRLAVVDLRDLLDAYISECTMFDCSVCSYDTDRRLRYLRDSTSAFSITKSDATDDYILLTGIHAMLTPVSGSWHGTNEGADYETWAANCVRRLSIGLKFNGTSFEILDIDSRAPAWATWYEEGLTTYFGHEYNETLEQVHDSNFVYCLVKDESWWLARDGGEGNPYDENTSYLECWEFPNATNEVERHARLNLSANFIKMTKHLDSDYIHFVTDNYIRVVEVNSGTGALTRQAGLDKHIQTDTGLTGSHSIGSTQNPLFYIGNYAFFAGTLRTAANVDKNLIAIYEINPATGVLTYNKHSLYTDLYGSSWRIGSSNRPRKYILPYTYDGTTYVLTPKWQNWSFHDGFLKWEWDSTNEELIPYSQALPYTTFDGGNGTVEEMQLLTINDKLILFSTKAHKSRINAYVLSEFYNTHGFNYTTTLDGKTIDYIDLNFVISNLCGDSCTFKSHIISGGAVANDETIYTESSNKIFKHQYTVSPSTASPWTPNEIENITAGVEILPTYPICIANAHKLIQLNLTAYYTEIGNPEIRVRDLWASIIYRPTEQTVELQNPSEVISDHDRIIRMINFWDGTREVYDVKRSNKKLLLRGMEYSYTTDPFIEFTKLRTIGKRGSTVAINDFTYSYFNGKYKILSFSYRVISERPMVYEWMLELGDVEL